MIEKIATYTARLIRYTMTKEEYEEFKTSQEVIDIISETEDKITVDVVDSRRIEERFK